MIFSINLDYHDLKSGKYGSKSKRTCLGTFLHIHFSFSSFTIHSDVSQTSPFTVRFNKRLNRTVIGSLNIGGEITGGQFLHAAVVGDALTTHSIP